MCWRRKRNSQTLVSDSIRPRLIPDIEVVPWRNLNVLAVQVYPSNTRPHYLERLGPEDGVFIRVGSTNRKAETLQIEELKRLNWRTTFDADEDSVFGAQPFQVVRAGVARVDLHSQHVQIPPRHHLDIGNEAWTDRIGNQVCEFLFRCKHVGHTADILRSVLHADDDNTASSVRERNQAFENAIWGGQVPLEFEGLPFGALQQFEQDHNSAFYSEVLLAASLPSPSTGLCQNCAKTHPLDCLGLAIERKAGSPSCCKHKEWAITNGAFGSHASPLGAGGRAFKSPRPDQISLIQRKVTRSPFSPSLCQNCQRRPCP